jgi:hypothetical protein
LSDAWCFAPSFYKTGNERKAGEQPGNSFRVLQVVQPVPHIYFEEVTSMRKKKDIGKPTVIVHTLPGTPEQIAENRERLRSVCESAVSELAGRPMEVKLIWGDEKKA